MRHLTMGYGCRILSLGSELWMVLKDYLSYFVTISQHLYSNNSRSSTKSKHIDIKLLVVKERVQSGQVSIEHIGTNSMVANPFTKGLPSKVFHEHTTHMGVLSLRICCFSGNLNFECFSVVRHILWLLLWIIYGSFLQK